MGRTQLKKKDWDATARRLTAACNRAKSVPKKVVVEFAEEVAKEWQKRIYGQQFRLKKLTREYMDWKIAFGYDRRILIRTGKYVESVIVRRTKTGAMVDLDARKRTFSGEPLWKLAHWLEYGTSKMDPRPHWRPLIPWVRVEWPRHFKKEVDSRVRGT